MKINQIKFKELRELTLGCSAPFQLNLDNSKHPLICENILRILPKKRLVVCGTWNNQSIVAKIFFEKAKTHILKETKGVRALIESGIDTPKILFSGSSFKNNIQILIFERIFQADDFQNSWETKSKDLPEIMDRLTTELATQHVLGILQHDLHFKNFLINENKIFTIDAADIEKRLIPIGKKESLINLALFFSQLGAGSEKLQQQLFAIYAKARGWLIKQSDVLFLEQTVKKWNRTRWKDYNKKIKRTCSAFIRHETFAKTFMVERDYYSVNFKEFLKDPEKYFNDPNVKILKAGNSSTVIEIKVDDRLLVIKRYNIKSFMHGLRRWLRQTRAERSWQFAHLLRLFSIPTAKPVAYIENHYFGWNTKSYFIMEKIPGDHAGVFFEDYNEQASSYFEMAEKIILLFENLKSIGVTHGDLKMTNILIHNNMPWLIDLDGMRKHVTHKSLKHTFNSEMARFIRNWENSFKLKQLFLGLLSV